MNFQLQIIKIFIKISFKIVLIENATASETALGTYALKFSSERLIHNKPRRESLER